MNAIIELSGQAARTEDREALPLWRINRLLSYIETNLSEHIGVPELSDLVRLSPTHLSRSFKRHFGVGLRVYVLCRRVVMAQNLMLMTERP